MAQITYADKVAINENPNVADINKVKADDMNEIKQVVNENDTTLSNLIANEYIESESNTYSCDYINNNLMPYVLFDGSSKDTITLSDSASNYEYFEIYYANEASIYNSTKVCNPQGKSVSLITSWTYDTSTGGTQIQTKTIFISNNQITNSNFSNFNVDSGGTWSGTYNSIYIKRVVGYK